jgi:hypothetical protein
VPLVYCHHPSQTDDKFKKINSSIGIQKVKKACKKFLEIVNKPIAKIVNGRINVRLILGCKEDLEH